MDTKNYRDIIYEVEDGIGRLTLNKPEKLNALSWSSWAEIEHAVNRAEEDDATRVIVITGAGRGFTAGTDLTSTLEESDWWARPFAGCEEQMRSRSCRRRGSIRTSPFSRWHHSCRAPLTQLRVLEFHSMPTPSR